MKNKFVSLMKRYYAFVMAASLVPVAYLLASPCASGQQCGACPSGGSCIIAFPILFGAVIVVRGFRKVRRTLGT